MTHPKAAEARASLPLGEGGLVLLLGALVAFGPLAIDLYLPALPAIASGLHAGMEQVELTVTVFLAGFCCGMLCYGPLSDRFGRRPMLLGGMGLFMLASVVCALADSVHMLIVARFFQALGGGAASVLARAVARDVYAPTEAIRKLSLMAMVTAIAPLVAPLLGSFALHWGSWRATFSLVAVWGALCLLITGWRLPETLPAAQRGQAGLGEAFAAYGRMLANPAAWGLVLAGGMSFGGMFAYITAGPAYFIRYQGMSPWGYSLLFTANAVGILLANFCNSRWVHRIGPDRLAGVGSVTGLAACAALVGCMEVHPLGVIVALFFAVSVTGLLGANCVGLLMRGYARNAGAAAALFGTGQFGFGMLASAAVGTFHDGTGRPMAWVMLGTAVLSLLGFGLYRAYRDARFVAG